MDTLRFIYEEWLEEELEMRILLLLCSPVLVPLCLVDAWRDRRHPPAPRAALLYGAPTELRFDAVTLENVTYVGQDGDRQLTSVTFDGAVCWLQLTADGATREVVSSTKVHLLLELEVAEQLVRWSERREVVTGTLSVTTGPERGMAGQFEKLELETVSLTDESEQIAVGPRYGSP